MWENLMKHQEYDQVIFHPKISYIYFSFILFLGPYIISTLHLFYFLNTINK